MRKLSMFLWGICFSMPLFAQSTFPVNGVGDQRDICYAFIHATLVRDGQNTLSDATLVIRDRKISAVGNNVTIPADAIIIDCKGKYIYPSFIDIYADYGIATPQRPQGGGFFGPQQISSNQKGAYGWNQAIRTDVEGSKIFTVDDAKAKPLRELGFGTVLAHQKDGIARGSGTIVSLASLKENQVIIKEKASAHYSFNKGSSTQSYPGSLMGSISLLRQSYIDAQWYKNNADKEGTNLSLQAYRRPSYTVA
jgi:hypothetical protein